MVIVPTAAILGFRSVDCVSMNRAIGKQVLRSDRTINVVDRSATQRSEREAISDHATVIYRTILIGDDRALGGVQQ